MFMYILCITQLTKNSRHIYLSTFIKLPMCVFWPFLKFIFKQDWKGFQSPRLRLIAVDYNGFKKDHDYGNLTRIWRESDENLTSWWLMTCIFIVLSSSNSDKFRATNNKTTTKKKAGPRRLALAQPKKYLLT